MFEVFTHKFSKMLAKRQEILYCGIIPETKSRGILATIIQQIVTMPIYGKEALNICHLYMTDVLRYT